MTRQSLYLYSKGWAWLENVHLVSCIFLFLPCIWLNFTFWYLSCWTCFLWINVSDICVTRPLDTLLNDIFCSPFPVLTSCPECSQCNYKYPYYRILSYTLQTISQLILYLKTKEKKCSKKEGIGRMKYNY